MGYMYLVILTEEQRVELNRRAHERGIAPSTRDRLEMVRLSDVGWSVPRLARHLDQHEQTVRLWIKSYLLRGFDGLVSKRHLGKRSALTAAMIDGIRARIGNSERTWTARQIGEWVSEQYGVTLSPERLRLHLRRAGLSWQRTSRDLTHKQKPEEVQERRVTLQTLEKGGMKG